MKVCPECRTKNDDVNNFCKKCGFLMAGSSFKEKREKVLGEQRNFRWIFISFILIALVLGGVGFWIIQGRTTAHPKIAAQRKVMERVDYSGMAIPMTDIEASVDHGRISIPLDVLKEKKMVRFEYGNNEVKIPILAYVTSSGRVVAAISMCEPCRSTHFHIQGKTLVCNACNTEWNLENLRGIQGGCVNYPPEVIPSSIEKGRVLIEEKVVHDWKPRT